MSSTRDLLDALRRAETAERKLAQIAELLESKTRRDATDPEMNTYFLIDQEAIREILEDTK